MPRRLMLPGMLAFLLAVVVTTPALAQKKPGGGGGAVPPGKIFYTWGSEFGAGGSPPYYEYRGFWGMNADGGGKLQLPDLPDNAIDLSHDLHAGHRWYLAGGSSPTDPAYGALFAVRDDGDPGSTVVLVDLVYFEGSRWAKDDSFIAFSQRNLATGAMEIWAASVVFDATTGRPALTEPPSVLVTEPVAVIVDFDFSPTGDEVVYEVRSGDGPSDLVIKDLVGGTTRGLLSNARAPRWSPDGTRITCYALDEGIHVINPDGTGLVLLKSGATPADWSPDSKHILFRWWTWKNGPGTSIYSCDTMRVSVTGGSAVNMTRDIDGCAEALWWR